MINEKEKFHEFIKENETEPEMEKIECKYCGMKVSRDDHDEKHDVFCKYSMTAIYIIAVDYGNKIDRYIASEFHAKRSEVEIILLDGTKIGVNSFHCIFKRFERLTVKEVKEFMKTPEGKEFVTTGNEVMEKWKIFHGETES